MKPYNKAQTIPLSKHLDRRRRLTDKDRLSIPRLYRQGVSIHQIARDIGCSKRTVQFVLFPERLARVVERARERGQSRKSYEKVRGEKWAARMRELRNRKYQLFINKQT